MAAITITFGSFRPMNTGCTLPPVKAVATPVCAAPPKTDYVESGRKLIAEYDQKVNKAFSSLESINNHIKRGTYATISHKANRVQLKYPTMSAVKRILMREEEEKKATAAFLGGAPMIVSHITIGGGPAPSIAEVLEPKRPLNKTRSNKQRVKPITPVRCTAHQLNKLVLEVGQLSAIHGLSIEVVDKHATKLGRRFRHGRLHLAARTAHHGNKILPCDCPTTPWAQDFIYKLATAYEPAAITESSIESGDSGLVAIKRDRKGFGGDNSLFIVRGRLNNSLVNALDTLSKHDITRISHYSEGDQFFNSFAESYAADKPSWLDHECSSDLNIRECGTVAGLVCQALMPSGKITCSACSWRLGSVSQEEYWKLVDERMMQCERQIQEKHPLFSHASSLINTIRSGRRFPALNVEAYGTVHKIVGQQKNSPLGNIAKINDVLIKGAQATPEQSGAALENLLELTRYLKNRSDTIGAGDIKHFRNKISAKTHVNPVLMCDNQLDKNGNFVWGERGYHAKRFFANYFEQITPGNDYEEWIERAGPNGSRKLGIGNLVVSTDMAKFRQQLRGEAIERQPVSEACCSRIGTNFIYPVCCVTHDSGEPVYSELMMPTKNHLVIGNTGDQKFLDLPADISDNLYMAKEGYCYLNIFLAMLVNVDEKDAKAFTKMVRDIVVPRLQKWPTAIDLATMCAFLAVFFPAVGAAELPKILVDHATKTMHVTDAFGSLTTGYHILKASTINHFVKFANDDLQGEMKTYRVGGTPQSNNANVMTFVMKSIYKPKLMEQALRDEPYLLVASMLSPAVLVALHNSGSLERCIEIWVGRSRGLVEMAVVLTGLAKRVSRAKLFADQIKILQDGAPRLTSAIVDGFQLNVSYMYAIQTLSEISARREADEALVANQFQNLLHESQELVEKIYVKELEVYWQELSWREKFSVFWESRRRSQSRIAYVEPETETAFIATSTVSFRPYVQRVMRSARKRVSDSVEACQRKAWRLAGRAFCSLMGIPRILIPDLQTLLNVAVVISASMTTIMALQRVITEHQKAKRAEASLHESKQRNRIHIYYQAFKKFCEKHPDVNEHTSAEFYQYLKYYDTGLAEFYIQSDEDIVLFQAKRKEEAQLEGIIATIALALMVFDAERSDCAYRVLNKIKNLVQTADEGVTFQGEKEIDEILNSLEEKNQTVDFELNIERPPPSLTEPTFQEWWNKQLTNGCTVPHYRTEGHFLEFTRATAAITAHNIVHDTEHKDFLVRGAVGSGKSTGLPFHLSKKGSVLVLEPTRPLAENVTKQLKGEPFFASPTMRMRGSSIFGHTNITIMTSGFALHFYANNLIQLKDIDFIIIDECHVNDSAAIAFRNLLVHHEYQGKVIKTSATPPGREVEFETQKPVTVVAEEQLSFQGFVEAQGSGSNADVIKRGSNILIYVASYNEVDRLSDMLVKRQFKVSKVDGRTMKIGRTEIETHGVPGKPHFIVATNIIENGVTLDIDVVVDFGVKVVPFLDVDNRMMAYNKVPISYGERIQRCGRVGRHKPGVALRVGPTMKGLSEVPPVIATEAAFLCFTYGLPVTTQGVSTSLLSSVTMRQARTMNHFELPIFYTAGLVRYDGAMHPAIHEILKPFKLRDSDIVLNKLAIPNEVVSFWMSGAAYQRATGHNTLQDSTRVPFLSKDVPDKVHEAIWSAVTKFRKDGGIGRMTSAQACKVAYTLQTDIWSIPRTVQTIDHLLAREHEKKAYFQTVVQHVSTTSGFSLAGILRSIQSRYAEDHTTSNIETLERAKAQLLEYKNISSYSETPELLRPFGYLETVTFQSENDIATFLNLGGFWKKSLIAKDFIVAAAVAAGSFWLIGTWAYNKCKEGVGFQGYNKRQRQKLKFREARQDKMGRVAYGDDDTIEQIFGPAYTAKGKKSGKTKGMGVKTRRFTNMYGFDPTEYSFIRFLDPLTGATLDESPYTDISVVQERFGELRSKQIIEGELEMDAVNYKPGITAYFVKEGAKKALKVDLTPHIPLKVCDRAAAVAGFPEREGQLRQTGTPQVVDTSDVPAERDVVEFEARSLAIGLRDYNPIARSVAQLHNESPEEPTRLFGIGFGTVIITNQHLLRHNNGGMTITTQYGTFKVHASCQLKVHPLAGRDIALIQLPKDQPPFPCKLQFRKPEDGERVVMVSTNFQTKNATSIVSDSSSVAPVHNSSFWRYWISTKDGQCGNPIVATSDGKIVGIHSLASTSKQNNFFVGFPEDFGEILCALESLEWTKGWKLNIDSLSWGSLRFKEDKPGGMFKTAKLVEDLVGFQGGWMMEAACGNLRPVAFCPNQLVTKHVVLGKCQHFQKYLATHMEADQFFKPLLGAYQPSKLNKEAFIKDIMKYSSVITVGAVDCATFDLVVHSFIDELGELGFKDLEYVTDELAIFRSLNMKASVGALYAGKKRDYFKDYTPEDMEAILRESCERLYKGQMGLWNGSLKAELRPLEKTLENKTRVFTAAPLDSLLGGKVCVDDFNNHFYSKNLQGPWTVGMTKFYAGWDKLMSLLPEGWVYCDADGSQFDSSLSPYLLNAVLTIRLRCMERWHIGEVMLSNLYTEILYTPIATPDGTVLKKFKGNNSGQPSTVVDNTLMVVLAMKYALCKSGIELTEQNDVCRFFVNGDDLIIALHPDKAHILDNFSELFLQLGLKYDFSTRTQCKTDLWFMSHQAMHYKGILIPKLEKERVVSILEWNRSEEPVHRLEAICAAMIEAWGHEELLHQVRLFYQWLLSEEPFDAIDAAGVAPYITEPALHNLYCNTEVGNSAYIEALADSESDDEDDVVVFQGRDDERVDAGASGSTSSKNKDLATQQQPAQGAGPSAVAQQINSTKGTFSLPRIERAASKMRIPRVGGKALVNLDHLIAYKPDAEQLYNTRATEDQLAAWVSGIKRDLDIDDDALQLVLNGFMVWCIENGTSPNMNGSWVMIEGNQQVVYPLKPMIENAQPSLRQIMAHFSDLAESYIEMRNKERPYMPRYGLVRNLNDMGLARYAFDFYEMNSRTPPRAREAHIQMKAAALRGKESRLFGLDGGVSTTQENTEHHTTGDVNAHMHSLLGVRMA